MTAVARRDGRGIGVDGGVYWRPVWAVLEDRFRLLLVNARHVKHVPGRKTDGRDCEWVLQLLECGLLRGSFVPPAEIRDPRDLTRLRKTLVRERSSQVNRVGKVLELTNAKLGSVVSHVIGATGRAILEAMIAGEGDPKAPAGLAKGSLRASAGSWRKSFSGWFATTTASCFAGDRRAGPPDRDDRGADPRGDDRLFRGGPRPSGERSGGGAAVGGGDSGRDRR